MCISSFGLSFTQFAIKKIEEMRITIEDLEALKELSDEMEENHLETEKALQEDLGIYQVWYHIFLLDTSTILQMRGTSSSANKRRRYKAWKMLART